MSREHPCDICAQKECDFDCVFDRLRYQTGSCFAECIYRHEDSCELNAYQQCGVWMKENGITIGNEEEDNGRQEEP